MQCPHKPIGMWVRLLLFFGLAVGPGLAQTTQLKVGFLSSRSQESWLQETWSQFKLAVQDVNADATLLPGHQLTFVVEDVEANSISVLQGAKRLAAAGVTATITTAEGDAMAGAATYASVVGMPVLSPSSTALEFADKGTTYPFLFRTMQGDADVYKGMAVLCKELGWLRVATVVNNDLRAGERDILNPSLQVLNIIPLTLRYPSPVDAASQQLTMRALGMALHSSGTQRVVLLLPKRVDVPFVMAVAGQMGMQAPRISWVVPQEAYVGPWMASTDMIVAMRTDSGPNPTRDAFAARWPTVATKYNATVHGPYDPATKLPFYDNADATIWDTGDVGLPGSLPPGDQRPDMFGMSTYDAVFVLAKALQAAITTGASPNNGTAVRNALMGASHQGVTGALSFDPSLQDRTAPVQLILTQGMSAPHMIGQTTSAIHSAFSATWCSSGCLTATAQQLNALPWSTGTRPDDGRGIADTPSAAMQFTPDVTEGTDLRVGIATRDGFGQVPCEDTCNQADQGICNACINDLMKPSMERFTLEFFDAQGNRIPGRGHIRKDHLSLGAMLLTQYGGLEGQSAEDREVTYKITLNGVPIATPDGIGNMTLRSLACKTGEFGPNGSQVCAQQVCTPCTRCLPGTIAPTKASSSCSACPQGTHQPEPGKGMCNNCTAGKYADRNGQSECMACELATYAPQPGSLQCVPCPVNMTTRSSQSQSITDCVCVEGTYLPAGTVLSQGMVPPCRSCKQGMLCPVGSDERNFPNASTNVSSAYMQEFPFPLLKPAHWTSADLPLEVFECLKQSHCPGGPPQACGPHMEGLTCALCEEGFYEREGRCESCSNNPILKILFPFVPIIVSVLVIGPLYVINKDGGMRTWNKSRNQLSQLLALCIIYAQSAGLILSSNVVGLSKEAMESSSIMNIVNMPLDLLQIECAGLRSFSAMLLAELAMPGYFLLLMCVFGLANYLVGLVLPKLRLDLHVLHSSAGSAFTLSYITICAISFDLFKCYLHPNNEVTMVSAPQVICYEGNWMTMMGAAMAAVAIYCLGSMIVFIWALRVAPKRVADKDFNKRWKFMLMKYRPAASWWFVVVLVKGIALNLVQAIFRLGQDQLVCLQIILTLYALGVASLHPHRHATCNDVDTAGHVFLALACNPAFWYAPAQGESSLRSVIVMHGLWVPVVALALLAIFHGVKHLPWFKKATRRNTVNSMNLEEWIGDYHAFGELEGAEFYLFLEGMSPEDRSMVKKVGKDIDVMLERWTMESSRAIVQRLSTRSSGRLSHISARMTAASRVSNTTVAADLAGDAERDFEEEEQEEGTKFERI